MHPIITGVEPGSPAEKAGLCPGDRLIAINGNEIGDVLDYMFHSEETKHA
jgi:predicted metalloprotease with PDZ domain